MKRYMILLHDLAAGSIAVAGTYSDVDSMQADFQRNRLAYGSSIREGLVRLDCVALCQSTAEEEAR